MPKSPDPSLKLVFAGTPGFGVPSLAALAASQHELKAVYTQPDRAQGRGQTMDHSAVKAWAVEHQVPVFQPENFKSEAALEQLKALNPDVMVVIAYGLILPSTVLKIPRLGCINVHASLLPSWRGASPIQSAILNGDVETGVTLIQMDVGMDTGDMLAKVATPIGMHETAGSLHDKLSQLAINPLLDVLNKLASSSLEPVPQDHSQPTYTKKILKEHARIDWTQSAEMIEREIRAYQPWPVSYTYYGEHRVRIFEAQVEPTTSSCTPGTLLEIEEKGILVNTGHQALRIQALQFPGGKVLRVADWLRGHSPLLSKGKVFNEI